MEHEKLRNAALQVKRKKKKHNKNIRAADAKEVGVGNPAEETYCYPNKVSVSSAGGLSNSYWNSSSAVSAVFYAKHSKRAFDFHRLSFAGNLAPNASPQGAHLFFCVSGSSLFRYKGDDAT
jgi:hypothetical protein